MPKGLGRPGSLLGSLVLDLGLAVLLMGRIGLFHHQRGFPLERPVGGELSGHAGFGSGAFHARLRP